MTTLPMPWLTLAQAPSPLPPTPILPRLLFENPWPLAGAFAAGAVIAAMLLRSRGRGRMGLGVAGGALLAAAGVVAMSRARVTEPERLRAVTAELVGAAARADEARLLALLGEGAQVWLGSRAAADGREAILARVRATLGGPWAVKSHDILESRAHVDGARVARSQVLVRVVPEATGFPHSSWWTIHWRRTVSGAWVAERLEPWSEDLASGLR